MVGWCHVVSKSSTCGSHTSIRKLSSATNSRFRVSVFQPHTYGRYLLLDRVSVGGMAEIFKAVSLDGRPNREPLVLKRVLPHLSVEPSFIKMFSNEAAFCIQLDHPNIINTYDFGEAEGNHYITMEYVPGQDLLSVHQVVREPANAYLLNLQASFCRKSQRGFTTPMSWRELTAVPLA